MVQCVREVWSGLRRWNTLKVLEAGCGSEGEEHSSNGLSARHPHKAIEDCQLDGATKYIQSIQVTPRGKHKEERRANNNHPDKKP